MARRTANGWDDAAVARLTAPLTAAVLVAGALLPLLGLYPPAAAASYRVLRAALLFVFFWSLWRLVDVGRQFAAHTPWARSAAARGARRPRARAARAAEDLARGDHGEKLRELGRSALVIEVMAWFQTVDWDEFTAIRQDLLLQFMEIVERTGTGFAFPTSTVHVASLPAGAPAAGADAVSFWWF